jgi:hypothetical protein
MISLSYFIGVIPLPPHDSTKPDYTYYPLQDSRHRYCGAPRHQMTKVRAQWVEVFNVEGFEEVNGERLSCDDCHEDTLRAFMDQVLPELTDEEIDDLPEEEKARLLAGEYDVPEGDAPLTPEMRQWIRERVGSGYANPELS